MKNIYEVLKFRIGSESYDYEFEIIPIPPYQFLENNLSLESYEYFGEAEYLFGLKIHQVLLYYNADVLMRVKLVIKGIHLQYLKQQIEGGNYWLPNSMSLKISTDRENQETVVEYQTKKLVQNKTNK